MNKTITDGQQRSLTASFLIDTPWKQGVQGDVERFLMLPAAVRGQRWKAFLENGGRLVTGPFMLPINRRAEVTVPNKVNRGGFADMRMMKNDPLEISREDERSLALSWINWTKVSFDQELERTPTKIPLDVAVAQALLDDQKQRGDLSYLSTLVQEETISSGMFAIVFPGTVLKDESNRSFYPVIWNGFGNTAYLDTTRVSEPGSETDHAMVYATLNVEA